MSPNQEVDLVEVVLRDVVLLEVALREAVLRTVMTLQKRILAARAPHPEGDTPTLSTRTEDQDHADRVPTKDQ